MLRIGVAAALTAQRYNRGDVYLSLTHLIPTRKEQVKQWQIKKDQLLKRRGMTTRKPVLQYDWEEPLRYPWIEMNEEN